MAQRQLSHVIIFSTLVTAAAGVSPASAQTVSVETTTQYVRVGTSFDVNLGINGLTASGAPSLGAYDFLLLFDPGLVSLQSNSFNAVLSADPLNSIFGVDTATLGQINLFEVSLESAANLNATQGDTLALGSATFLAQSVGVANFSLNGLAFADADGLAVMPTFRNASITIVDRTSINEFAQPLSGTLMASLAMADLTQSCDHRYMKALSGGSGSKGCLFAGGSFSDSKFKTVQVNEDANSYYGGGQVQLVNGFLFGGSIAGGNFDTNYRGMSSIKDGDRFSFSGLVGWNFNPVTITGGYTHTKSDGVLRTRHANLGGLVSETPVDATSEAFMVRASTETQLGGLSVVPALSVASVTTEMEVLQENGASVLTVLGERSSDTSYVAKVNVDFSKTYGGSGNPIIRPHLGLGWQHTSSDMYQIRARFADNLAAATPDLQTTLNLLDSSIFTVEPGISIGLNENVSFSFNYQGAFGSNTTQHVGSGAVRFVF